MVRFCPHRRLGTVRFIRGMCSPALAIGQGRTGVGRPHLSGLSFQIQARSRGIAMKEPLWVYAVMLLAIGGMFLLVAELPMPPN
jgi:hypothetical protein